MAASKTAYQDAKQRTRQHIVLEMQKEERLRVPPVMCSRVRGSKRVALIVSGELTNFRHGLATVHIDLPLPRVQQLIDGLTLLLSQGRPTN